MNRDLNTIAIGILITAGPLLAGGCSALPGFSTHPIYVNLQQLARLRPEWQSVTDLDRQMAGVPAAAALANHPESGMAGAPAIQLTRLSTAPTPSPSPDLPRTQNVDEEIRTRIDTIRRELEEEARGELELYSLNKRQQFDADLYTALLALETDYANRRLNILSSYKSQYTNLQLADTMYRSWMDALPPPSVRTASDQRDFDSLNVLLQKTDAQMKVMVQEQSDAVARNQAQRLAAENDLRTRLRNELRGLLADHQAETDARIKDAVQKAELDEAREARSRLRNFESGSLYSFTGGSLEMNSPPPPVVNLIPPVHPDSVLVDASVAAQRRNLEVQRNALAALILRDTSIWAHGIADRRKWSLADKPGAGVPDHTADFARWIQQETIPPPVPNA